MRTREKYLYSTTKTDRIFVKMWLPDEEPEIIVQLAHGMVEHIERYDDFARFLCSQGIGVVGNDHLGHGKSVSSSSQYGYFAKKNGAEAVLSDMYLVTRYIKHQYPKCRLFLFGHSMGSFFARKYITRYDKHLDGVILSGTGHQPFLLVAAGRLLAGAIMVARGQFYRSKLLLSLTTGDYKKYFEEDECKSWLSRDPEVEACYMADPKCHFWFTASAYYDFFGLLMELSAKKGFHRINRRLPIFLFSGMEDPVGDFGDGVKKVYRTFCRMGMKKVWLKLYPKGRHEMLNEINKQEVYQDILTWILEQL